ncbi:unnamed protein product, partial [Ceratitis capitata]
HQQLRERLLANHYTDFSTEPKAKGAEGQSAVGGEQAARRLFQGAAVNVGVRCAVSCGDCVASLLYCTFSYSFLMGRTSFTQSCHGRRTTRES